MITAELKQVHQPEQRARDPDQQPGEWYVEESPETPACPEPWKSQYRAAERQDDGYEHDDNDDFEPAVAHQIPDQLRDDTDSDRQVSVPPHRNQEYQYAEQGRHEETQSG